MVEFEIWKFYQTECVRCTFKRTSRWKIMIPLAFLSSHECNSVFGITWNLLNRMIESTCKWKKWSLRCYSSVLRHTKAYIRYVEGVCGEKMQGKWRMSKNSKNGFSEVFKFWHKVILSLEEFFFCFLVFLLLFLSSDGEWNTSFIDN